MSSRITGRWTTVLLGALTIAACSDNPQKVKQDAVARGDQFAKDNKYGEAIIEYRRAIQADAQVGEGHLKLADTLLKNEDVIGAIREYIRAADLLPNDVDLQVKVGNMLLAAGRFDDARVRAEKALEKNSKNGPALVLRGNAMAGLKDLDAALSDMETALASDPGKATTYANLGLLQSLRGDAGKAEEAFTTAIQTDGANVQVRLAYEIGRAHV